MSSQKLQNPENAQTDEASHLAELAGLDNGQTDVDKVPPDEDPETLSRRKFLRRLSYAVGGVGVIIAAVPIAGFIFGEVFKSKPEVWREVGALDEFKPGKTVEVTFTNSNPLPWGGGVTKSAAWLQRSEDGSILVFSINCTHLGCPVDWVEAAKLFLCPCHGGVYYQNGNVAAGPPPRGLIRYQVRIRDGKVEIETSNVPLTSFAA
ncbi:MAG TPA: Rieske (2Fe-2S) protein [Chloroflexia bacterium]|nr:Rieske (2Fe-2S) protein [Chloroflexia bacterium]